MANPENIDLRDALDELGRGLAVLSSPLRQSELPVKEREEAVVRQLEAARNALSHAMPNATTEEILDAGLDLLLAERAKKKAALVANPREESPAPNDAADDIPASVKRAVWKRDGGKCQWALASGGMCESTTRPEFAHVVARADGGLPTIENIRLLCRFHNQYEARLRFGDAFVDRFAGKRSPEPSRPRRRARAQRQASLALGP